MRSNDQEDNCGEESQGGVQNPFVCYLDIFNLVRQINQSINRSNQLMNHLLDQPSNQHFQSFNQLII